jgi:hypothetical protein
MHVLSNALHSLALGTPVSTDRLAMVPLLHPQPDAPDYLLLDETLDGGLAEVTEVSGDGAVPELRFRNRAERDVLLVDGEELVGAKQNRVLNLTILAPALSEITIPVSCVEAGRWAWRSQRFAAGRRELHARARAEKMRGVSAALREEGRRARGDVQSAVWRAVDDKLAFFDVASDTRALRDAWEATEPRLRVLRETFVARPDQVGAAFFIGGTLVGLDLFDAPATLAKLLPKLVDSYAIDALECEDESAQRPSLEAVRALLARIAQAPAAAYPAVGKGTDLRIDAGGLQAAALVDGERLVHLSAFAVEPAP